jgi:hypothetical protein
LQEIHNSACRNNTTDPKVIAKCVAKWVSCFFTLLFLLTYFCRAFSFMLEKDHRHHGSNPDEEIPAATTTTDDTVISYQANINAALDARNQGQDLLTKAEGEREQIESGAGVLAEAPEVEITA